MQPKVVKIKYCVEKLLPKTEISSSSWSWNRLQVQTFNRFSFSAMNQHRIAWPKHWLMLKYENPKIFYQFPVQTLRLNLIDHFLSIQTLISTDLNMNREVVKERKWHLLLFKYLPNAFENSARISRSWNKKTHIDPFFVFVFLQTKKKMKNSSKCFCWVSGQTAFFSSVSFNSMKLNCICGGCCSLLWILNRE